MKLFRYFWLAYLTTLVVVGIFGASKFRETLETLERRTFTQDCIDDFAGFEAYELEVSRMCREGLTFVMGE